MVERIKLDLPQLVRIMVEDIASYRNLYLKDVFLLFTSYILFCLLLDGSFLCLRLIRVAV